MTLTTRDTLGELDGVRTHASLAPQIFDQIEPLLGFALPAEHKETLRWSNGLETYAGYFRLFGLAQTPVSIQFCGISPSIGSSRGVTAVGATGVSARRHGATSMPTPLNRFMAMRPLRCTSLMPYP